MTEERSRQQSTVGAESLFADFLRRLEAGEQITFQDLKAAHPEVSQKLRRLYEDWVRLDELLPSRLSAAPVLSAPERDEDEHVLEIGAVFAARYAIRREIGRGGFGVVYEAFDQSPLQRAVALKVIRFQRASAADARSSAKGRFLQEARLAGKLSHNNIATILDIGEAAGCVYMTQELAPGLDLQKIIGKAGPLPLQRVLTIVRQACEGLAHAHAHGIVHRDVKPSNLVVDADDHVRITDFGLAQNVEVEGQESVGHVAGTPGFMAPEQLRGERVDSRADIFSLGCVLYTMLTNRAPFEGKTLGSIIEKTLHAVPQDPSKVREDLPRSLDRIVARALRKEADERYADIQLLAQDLAHYQHFEYLQEAGEGAAQIAASLRSGKSILFLGLELPVRQGKAEEATAERVFAGLLAESLNGPASRRRLPQIAQDLEMERGRAEMLRRLAVVARNPVVSPREVLRRVARLPFRMVVTTGYDTFLEQELERSGKRVRHVLDVRQAPDDLGGQDFVVNLFGRADQESALVVTEDDLWEFFGAFHGISDSLKSAFATRSIVFLGFDAEDEHFRHLVSELMRLRTGTGESWHLPVTDPTLNVVRWAERKNIRLVDEDPGQFLLLVEESLVQQKREESAQGSAPRAAQLTIPERPYKFLNYYDDADERIFCGRKAETLKMLSKIHAYPLNVLYAPSGSGKTSLIHAGLIPNLRRENYLAVYARVYDAPALEIQRSVLEASASRETLAGKVELSLSRFLAAAVEANGRPIAIFLDQFEEFFIRMSPEARGRFGAELQACLRETRGQVRFVLCLREDYLARLSELRTQLPTIFHNEFRLGALGLEEARSAIVEPAGLVGLEVEPELVAALLEDLAVEGIDPPQLQIVCDTLFDALLPHEKRLTLKAYRDLGGTRKILSGYLDRVLRELDKDERGPARQILKNLVTSEQTKSVSRIADLARAVGCEEKVVLEILGELSERRLIRRIQHEEGAWYELTHEYLVQEISLWLSEKERELKKVRELLEQAVRNHRQLGLFMPPKQIQLVRRHEDDLNLSKEELQFLRVSERAVQKRRKVAVVAAVAATIVALAALVGGRYAFLDSHWFLRSEDRELTSSGQFTGETASFRFEGIDVHEGSPNRWWLDEYLGFPKRSYRTDFVLDEIDPRFRDALKSGMALSAETEQQPLLEMLGPCDKVRYLATLEPIIDSGILLEPYSRPGVAEADLAELTYFLGRVGWRFNDWVSVAVESAFRRSTSFEFRPEYLLRTVLAFMPEDQAIAQLQPYLDLPRTREAAVSLLGGVVGPEHSSLIVPFAVDPDDEVRSAGLQELATTLDCTHLELLRRAVDEQLDPRSASGFSISRFLGQCGDGSDLPRIEKLAEARGYMFAVRSVFVEAAYELSGASAVPVIQRMIEGKPLDTWLLRTLASCDFVAFDPKIREALADPKAEVRAAAALVLAERGDPAGIVMAFSIARDAGQTTQARVLALEALAWFSSAESLELLDEQTRANEPELRSKACELLALEDGPEAVRLLVKALEDENGSVRSAAYFSLKRMQSEHATGILEERLHSGNPTIRVFIARTLQAMGRPDCRDVFEEFLVNAGESTTEYDALDWAVAGLRDDLLKTPVREIESFLRHPIQEMRLAGTMALLEHEDRVGVRRLLDELTKDQDSRVRTCCLRARWALGIVEGEEELIARVREELMRGEVDRAQRTIGEIRIRDYTATLGMGLARKYKVRLERFSFGDMGYGGFVAPRERLDQDLSDEILLRKGSRTEMLGLVKRWISDDRTRQQEIRDDPRFASLHDDYRFRVLTGMEPRRAIEISLK